MLDDAHSLRFNDEKLSFHNVEVNAYFASVAADFIRNKLIECSLDLLMQAVQFTNRSYIFDNSTHEHIWLAEITDGQVLEMKTDQVPEWFRKALGGKFNIENKR